MNLNPENPLWLPEGSIRAGITIVLVTSVIVCAVLGREIPETLQNFTGIALAYYYATRQSRNNSDPKVLK